MQHPLPVAPAEVGDRVTDRVVLQMTDMRLAARVRQHLEDVRVTRRVVGRLGPAGEVVGHLPRVLALPQRLPPGLDRRWVVARVAHSVPEVTWVSRPHPRPIRPTDMRTYVRA